MFIRLKRRSNVINLYLFLVYCDYDAHNLDTNDIPQPTSSPLCTLVQLRGGPLYFSKVNTHPGSQHWVASQPNFTRAVQMIVNITGEMKPKYKLSLVFRVRSVSEKSLLRCYKTQQPVSPGLQTCSQSQNITEATLRASEQ